MNHGRRPPLRARVKYVSAIIALCVAAPVQAHRGVDEQIAGLDTRIAESPGDATLYLRRGELHRIHLDWDASRADFEKARSIDRSLVQSDLYLGRMLLDAQRFDEALPILDAYVELRPDDVMGRVNRGRARAALGLWLPAVADYDHALAVTEPGRSSPTFFLERANALASAGDEHLDLAIRGLDDGIAALSYPVTLQLLAVEFELKLARYDDALERIDGIAARSKRQETWLLRRGEILESAGRLEQAHRTYADALDAIDALGPARRQNRAVQRLSTAAEEGLARVTLKQDEN